MERMELAHPSVQQFHSYRIGLSVQGFSPSPVPLSGHFNYEEGINIFRDKMSLNTFRLGKLSDVYLYIYIYIRKVYGVERVLVVTA